MKFRVVIAPDEDGVFVAECPALSVCSGADTVRAFQRVGDEVDHETGSHVILRHPSGRRLTVPNHRELAKGTLRALIRDAGVTKEPFAELL
jgi:predicted RNA binding protein YcfA (HicA-like mRNA interferase family)